MSTMAVPGMTASLVIAPRFCGPPGSANGGYASGLIAAHLGGQAEVTLRRPPPLARPMAVERHGEGSVRVLDGDVLIAEGTSLPDGPAVELPGPVTVRDARAAGLGSRLRAHPDEHPFPTCFVCGPARRPPDGRAGQEALVPARNSPSPLTTARASWPPAPGCRRHRAPAARSGACPPAARFRR